MICLLELESYSPPANAYYPKVGIADNLPKPNVRGGAFGAKEKVSD
jgi:hypothetical protein